MPAMLAEAGHGAALHALTAGSTLHALLLDGGAHADVLLDAAPAGASVERGEDGALLYRAARGGGALRYAGDAGPIGQGGELGLDAPQLPPDLRLAPQGSGFAFTAAQPTDLGLDWQPAAGEPLHVRARGSDALLASMGAPGLVLRGSGSVAAEQGAQRGEAQLDSGQALVLRAAGSPLLPAGLLVLAGGAVWAARARRAKA
jgi:hypothetical protein